MDILLSIVSFLEKLTVIGGICAGLFLIWNRNKMTRISQDNLQLKNWEQLQKIIDRDTEIRNHIFSFLEKMDNNANLSIDNLKKKYATGKLLYLSSELKEFSLIGRHYEQLGASLRLKYLPLELINEVIPFPDEFWDKTEKLREIISTNWFGDNKPLNSFWSNFAWMRKKWHEKRKIQQTIDP